MQEKQAQAQPFPQSFAGLQRLRLYAYLARHPGPCLHPSFGLLRVPLASASLASLDSPLLPWGSRCRLARDGVGGGEE